MICPKCKTLIHSHLANCPACYNAEGVGVPNVRAAETVENQDALNRRVDAAKRNAQGRGCLDKLESFHAQVANISRAVLCRPLGVVSAFVFSDNALYSSFYYQVDGKTRLPNEDMDKLRGVVDTKIFPSYHKEICFAALTLDGSGSWGYGEYAVVLKNLMIQDRATVFEENTVGFCEKHKIVLTAPVPVGLGYRGTWARRADVAIAKLEPRITSATEEAKFAALILTSFDDPARDEFIEVHIYKQFNRRAIEAVYKREPKDEKERKADTAIDQELSHQLKEIGITIKQI